MAEIVPVEQDTNGGGDPRQNLYSALSKQFDLGSFDEFNSKMDNPDSRKKLYDHVSKTKNIGTFAEFDAKMGKSIPQAGGSSQLASPSKQSVPSTSSATGVPPRGVSSVVSVGQKPDFTKIGAQLQPANRKTIMDQTGRQVTYDPTKQSLKVDPRTGQALVEDTPRELVRQNVNKEVMSKTKAPQRVLAATNAEDELMPTRDAVTQSMLLGLDYEAAKEFNNMDPEAMAEAVDAAALVKSRDLKRYPYQGQAFGSLEDDKSFMGAPALNNEVEQRVAEDVETINNIYGDLNRYGINAEDFNGYLNATNPRIKKLFEEGLINNEGGRDALALDNEKLKAVSNYMIDRSKHLSTMREALQYRQDNGEDVKEELDQVNSELNSLRSNLQSFVSTELPHYNEYLSNERAEIKKDYDKLRKGDKSYLESTLKGSREVLEGGYGALTTTAATLADMVGMDNTAEDLRLHNELNAMEWSNPLYYGYASGKKVNYKGKDYLVNPDTGLIADLDTKKNVAFIADELGINKDKIYEQARQSTEDDYSFSPAGAAYQSANVLGNLAVQVLGAKGVGAVTKAAGLAPTAVANSMAATGGFIYSQTYEDTLQTLRDQGMPEKDATKYANEVASATAMVGALTSMFSPNANAQALFSRGGIKGVIREGVDALNETGTKGLLGKIKDRVIQAMTKGLPEGTGEAIQENMEYAAQQLSSAAVNTQEGQNVLDADINADDVVNNAIMSFGASSLLASAGRMRTKDKLDIMNRLSTDYEAFNTQLTSQVEQGFVKPAEADKLRQQVDDFRKFKDRLPEGLPEESILPVTELLSQKEALLQKKKSVDKVFHEGIDKKIESVDSKIKETISNPPQDELQYEESAEPEIQTDEGVEAGQEGGSQTEEAVQSKRDVTSADRVKHEYDNSKELQDTGSLQEYNDYLDTVFPESTNKEVFQNRSREKKRSLKDFYQGVPSYFSQPGYYEEFGRILQHALLNVGNTANLGTDIHDKTLTKVLDNLRKMGFNSASARGRMTPIGRYFTERAAGLDSFLSSNPNATQAEIETFVQEQDKINKEDLEGVNVEDIKKFVDNFEFVVFDPDQIHVLGSEEDVKGFKEWKNNEQIKEGAEPAAEPTATPDTGGEGTAKEGAGRSKPKPTKAVQKPAPVVPEPKIEEVTSDKNTLGETFKRVANESKNQYYSVSEKSLKLKDIRARVKEAVRQGKITTSKAAQLVNSAMAVDPTNDAQVDRFFEKFGKSMAVAEKGYNLQQLQKDLKRVKSNVRTKLNRLGEDVRRMANLKVDNIPEDVFQEYSEVMGSLAKAKGIDKNRVNQLWEQVRDAYMAQEEERYDERLNAQPKVQDKLKEEVLLADAHRNLEYSPSDFNEYERSIIKRFENIPTRWLTENLSKADLRKATVALQGVSDGVLLNKTLNNITDRYVAQEASKSILDHASENVTYAGGLATNVDKTISNLFKSKKDPNSTGFSSAIANSMLQHVDTTVKGMKGKPLYENIIHPLTSRFNKAEEAANLVEKEFGKKLNMARRSREGSRAARLIQSVGKGLNLIKGNYFYEFDVLRQLYYRQLEADANKDLLGKKVNPVKAHMDALVNSNTISLSSLEKEVILDLYAKFSNEDGSMNMDKMERYFTPEEKAVIEYEQGVVSELEQLSREVNDHRKGESLQYINSYFPRKNDGDVFNDELDISKNLAGFLGSTSVKAGASNARTNVAKPLDFKTSRNFLTHVREGYMEHDLSDVVKRSGMILTNLTHSDRPDIVRLAQALQGSVKTLIESQFNRNPYSEDSAGMRVFRALVKNTANKMLIDPLRGLIDTVGNWGTFHAAYADRTADMARASKKVSKKFLTEELFKDFGSTQADRLMGSQGIDYRQGITSKTGEKKFGTYQPSVFDNFIDLMRHNTVTDFSQKVAQLQYAIADRPASLLWRMEFVDTFKQVAGKDFDMEKYQSNPNYKIDNEAAIKKAIVQADKSTSNLFNTATRAEQKLKVQASNNWWVKNFDSFMRSFTFNENKVFWDSLYSVFGKGTMSREDALRAFFIVNARSVAYSFAMQSAVIAAASLLSGGGADDEDTYKKAYKRALASHGMLAAMGNKGTTFNLVAGMGIEYLRAKEMESRGKKYNPYIDALLYVPPQRGNIDQYVGMMGAEGATLKSMYDFTKAGNKFLKKLDEGEEITNEDLIEIKAYQAFWSLIAQTTGLPVDRMSKVAQKTAEAQLAKIKAAKESNGSSQEKIDEMVKKAQEAMK